MKVLKFSATWCGPCKQLSKVIEAVGDFGTELVNIDVDEDFVLPTRFTVRGVPTCILVDDEGHEVRRKVGTMTETEFREFVTV